MLWSIKPFDFLQLVYEYLEMCNQYPKLVQPHLFTDLFRFLLTPQTTE